MKPRRQLDLTGLRVLDGGLATELEKARCDISGPLWSGHVLREKPDAVEAVHMAYLEAGADCISTASYQISRESFRDVGLSGGEAELALRRSVEIAERACTRYHRRRHRPVWIAASLGPYGAALHNGAEYTGIYRIDHAQLIAFHQRRIKALAMSAADFLLFETVPSLDEARAILSALAGVPDIAAAISFTCRDDRYTAHGESIAACAQELDGADQLIAIGVNCTAPELMVPLVRQMRSATTKRIAVYPNSGERWNAESRAWDANASDGSAAEQWRGLSAKWREAGADWVGGCCRTGPDHVRAVRKAMAHA